MDSICTVGGPPIPVILLLGSVHTCTLGGSVTLMKEMCHAPLVNELYMYLGIAVLRDLLACYAADENEKG